MRDQAEVRVLPVSSAGWRQDQVPGLHFHSFPGLPLPFLLVHFGAGTLHPEKVEVARFHPELVEVETSRLEAAMSHSGQEEAAMCLLPFFDMSGARRMSSGRQRRYPAGCTDP